MRDRVPKLRKDFVILFRSGAMVRLGKEVSGMGCPVASKRAKKRGGVGLLALGIPSFESFFLGGESGPLLGPMAGESDLEKGRSRLCWEMGELEGALRRPGPWVADSEESLWRPSSRSKGSRRGREGRVLPSLRCAMMAGLRAVSSNLAPMAAKRSARDFSKELM